MYFLRLSWELCEGGAILGFDCVFFPFLLNGSCRLQFYILKVYENVYYIAITNMFQPIMPILRVVRTRIQIQLYHSKDVFLFSPPWGWPHLWLKHVGDCYIIKLHSYIPVHLLVSLNSFILWGKYLSTVWWLILSLE